MHQKLLVVSFRLNPIHTAIDLKSSFTVLGVAITVSDVTVLRLSEF